MSILCWFETPSSIFISNMKTELLMKINLYIFLSRLFSYLFSKIQDLLFVTYTII